jgi:outer membrane PBP1 activator LpoA protein
MSLLDATNLRNRVHQIEDEHELMWTALDDIKRMYPEHPSAQLAERTLENVKTTYGR